MDPNLLPSEFRSQEEKEQARLKKQPAGFGVELSSPQAEKKSGLAGKGAPDGLWSKVFGRPVSPIIDQSRSEHAPSVAAKVPVVAGDSWSEIFKGLFAFGRKKRIDFRLAGSGREKADFEPAKLARVAPQAVPSKPVQPIVAERKHAPIPDEHSHNKEHHRAGSAYHSVPKREKAQEFNVNLMPQELVARLSAQGAGNMKSIAIAVIIPAVIITIGYGAMLLLQNDLKSRMTAKNAELADLQKQIGDFVKRENDNNLTADRVSTIKKLLDSKLIWSNFFADLEKYTLDGVYYNSMTADTSGVLTLPGVAEDYDVLARQVALLRDASDFVKDVKLTNAQQISQGKAGVVGIGFQLRLVLQDNVFKNPQAIK